MTEFENVSTCLRSNLSFLDQWQLVARPDEITHSALLGARLLLTYSSKATKRSIRIYYSAPHAGRPARFATFIDSGSGQSFFLDDYLLEQGSEKMLGFFHNQSPEKSTQDFSITFARILRIILENSFSDLLHGKSWEIAPFDWSPYK